MRKIRLLVLTVLLTSVLSLGVNAQSSTVSENVLKLGNTFLRSMTNTPIAFISDNITDEGDYISTFCETYTAETCDRLELVIYIQEKQDGVWKTVKKSTHNANNATEIVRSPTYHIPLKGRKYRVKAYHYATLNDKTYLEINYTGEITYK